MDELIALVVALLGYNIGFLLHLYSTIKTEELNYQILYSEKIALEVRANSLNSIAYGINIKGSYEVVDEHQTEKQRG